MFGCAEKYTLRTAHSALMMKKKKIMKMIKKMMMGMMMKMMMEMRKTLKKG